MIATIIVPGAFALAGLLLYMLAGNPKAVELGRITFACAMVVLVYVLAGRVVHV